MITCWIAEYICDPVEIIAPLPGQPFQRTYTGRSRGRQLHRRTESARLASAGDTDTIVDEQTRLKCQGDNNEDQDSSEDLSVD